MAIGINQVGKGQKRSGLPEVAFPTLVKLNRYRNVCLGLPVPASPLGIPYGYYEDPETKMLEPIEEIVQLLLQAKHYLRRGYPYSKVTEWVNVNAQDYIERTISPDTLRYIMTNRPPFEECALPRDEREKL